MTEPINENGSRKTGSKKSLIKKLGIVFVCLAVSLVLAVMFFLRNPQRDVVVDKNLIIAPCDGTVLNIRGREKDRTYIYCFLSLLNVHRFRIPVTGKVIEVEYKKGKFLNAASPRARIENESNRIVFQMNNNDIIEITQVAGLIGKRIYCDLKEGDIVQQGDLFGLISFGSGCLMNIPSNYNVKIDLKSPVRAGLTVIAELDQE